MKSVPSFSLLFMLELITLTQQIANFQNALPWLGHYYPFNAHAYPVYHGRYGQNVAIDQGGRHQHLPINDDHKEPMNRYSQFQGKVAGIDYFRSQPFRDQVSYNGASNRNDQPLGYEPKWAAPEPSGRFLGSGITIGTGATANYWLKTSFVFVTSNATLCFATSCIPASLFAAGASALICAKKKRDADDFLDEISPSAIEKMEPTASLTLGEIKFDERTPIESSSSPILFSSRDDESEPQDANERVKRFLFLLTTTITTYSFATTTYTSTLTPAAAGALTCRPSGIIVC